jgi:hypothetical protein
MGLFSVLEVRVHRYDPGWEPLIWVADLYIDRRPLVHLVREVEIPYARREGHPELAGSYVALPMEDVCLPSRHLLGEPRDLGVSSGTLGGRVPVLGCPCTDVGCWPLLVRIEVLEDRVVWRDFANPWRGPRWRKLEEQWRYDGLGPFTFRRAQYENALERPHGLTE